MLWYSKQDYLCPFSHQKETVLKWHQPNTHLIHGKQKKFLNLV